MPHLSPMCWIMGPVTVFLALFILTSALWWLQIPSFSLKLNSSSPLKTNYWRWPS